MKSNKEFRGKVDNFDSGDAIKKAIKLEPIKKSGKERHALFGELSQDEEDADLLTYKKRDSVLDYFDDGDEDDPEQEWEDDEDEDDFEDEDDALEEFEDEVEELEKA